MNKKTNHFLFLCWLLTFSVNIFAQTELDEDNSGTVFSSCSGVYTDDGGRSIYSDSYDTNNDNQPDFLCWTFCPPHPINEGVRFSFLEWDLHPSDEFRIRDGKNGVCGHGTLSPLIGTFTGHSPSQFDGSAGGTYAYGAGAWIQSSPTNSSGCLTIEFRPDGDGNKGAGWKIAVRCLQDSIAPSKLFISEYYNDCDGDMYIELFNPTDKKINLKDFSLRRQSGTTFGTDANAYKLPNTYIQPHSTYLVCKSRINSTVKPACDVSINPFGNGSWFSKIKCNEALGLFQKSFLIDKVGDQKQRASSKGIRVAGISDAISNYTLIRKKDIDCGSVDWTASSGSTEANSQWLLIPDGKFKNAGTHIFGNPKIFISEFYGKNKNDAFVEIYNGSGKSFPLNGLEIILAEGSEDWAGNAPANAPKYSGGWTQYDASAKILPLQGSLANKEVLVICNKEANPSILCQADIVLDGNSNNGQQALTLADGNDALGLFLNHVLIDVVGDPGSNKAHKIGRTHAATNYRILKRASGVRESNCDWYDSSSGIFSDWELLNHNDISSLGAHRKQPTKCFEQVIISEVLNTDSKIAIGIINKSSSSLNLGKIKIKLGTTGNGWDNEYISMPNGRSLAPDAEFIVYQSLDGGFEDIPSHQKMQTDQFFNGPAKRLKPDDAIAIIQADETLLDVFGDPDRQNNGLGYKIAGITNAIAHNIIRRKGAIALGNTKPMASLGSNRLNSEWFLVNNASLDGLGETNEGEEAPNIQYRMEETEGASCDGAGAFQIQVIGGTAPFRIFVNDVLRAEGTVAGLATGRHALNIKDPYGVNHRGSFDYIASTANTLEALVSKLQEPTCSGRNDGVAEVNSTQNELTYRWSNGITTARNEQLSAGTHHVTVTSPSGCEKVLSLQLESTSSIAASLSGQASACGNTTSGSITAEISGGSGSYSYLWSNGSIAPSLENVANGNYELTITDSKECTAIASIDLSGPSQMEVAATLTQPTCQSSIGSISLTVSGGSAPYSYNWNNTGFVQDQATLSNVTGGTHAVLLRDANGCELVQNYTLETVEPINARVDVLKNVSCSGAADGQATITTNQANLQFLWEDGSTAATNTNLAAGIHEVLVTNSFNCSILLQIQITASSSSDLVIHIDEPLTCANPIGIISADVLGGNDNYQFAWNTGHVHSDISIVKAGVYEVTVTNEAGCSLTQSIQVDNEEGQVVQRLTPSICEGERYETATNSYGATGVYQERYTSSEGCDSIVEIQLKVIPNPTLDLGIDRTISDKDTFLLQANHVYERYEWSTGSTQSFIRIIGARLPIGPNTFRLRASNGIGCFVEDDVTLTVKSSTDLMDPITLSQMRLFPNPTSGVITLQDKNTVFQPSVLQVYSAQGQLMQTARLMDRQQQFDLTGFTKGLYIVKITRGRSVGFQKIILE